MQARSPVRADHGRKRCDAFSLIELALVLVVLGLMVGFGLQALQSGGSSDCYAKTEAQLSTIDQALRNFAVTNSRFPKPAAMGYGSNNPSFAQEETGGGTPSSAAYATLVPSTVTNSGGVLIGALPVATLGLPTDTVADCWGSRYRYAVTNALTSSDSGVGYLSNALGTITVNTGTLASPQLVASNLAYVVISHGPDKFGATPLAASNIAARDCNGSSDSKIDRENCDISNNVFTTAARNGEKNAGANYFDDVLVYSAKTLLGCPAGTANWGGTCTNTYGALAHGSSVNITSSVGSGSATVVCNQGTASTTNEICGAAPINAVCPSDGSSNACDAGDVDWSTAMCDSACPQNCTWTCKGQNGGSDALCGATIDCGGTGCGTYGENEGGCSHGLCTRCCGGAEESCSTGGGVSSLPEWGVCNTPWQCFGH